MTVEGCISSCVRKKELTLIPPRHAFLTALIVNHTPSRGSALADRTRVEAGVRATSTVWEGRYPIPEATDGVVNATSIGLVPDTSARVPIDLTIVAPPFFVCDGIPGSPCTWLIKQALSLGCRVLDGLGMLVNQGAIALALWSGQARRPEINASCPSPLSTRPRSPSGAIHHQPDDSHSPARS
jgi:shikimate 5-dehydrogenase